MTIALTVEQRQLRVSNLGAQVQAINRTIEGINMRIGGLPKLYTKNQYGSKSKAMMKHAFNEYKTQAKKLIQMRDTTIEEIEKHQHILNS